MSGEISDGPEEYYAMQRSNEKNRILHRQDFAARMSLRMPTILLHTAALVSSHSVGVFPQALVG